MVSSAPTLDLSSETRSYYLFSPIRNFVQQQDLRLTSKIVPNWLSSWEEKKLSEKVGKMINELAKTFICLTLIIPIITFTADYINTKKMALEQGKKISEEREKTLALEKEKTLALEKKMALEQEKLKHTPKASSCKKITYVALAILGISVISTGIYFACPQNRSQIFTSQVWKSTTSFANNYIPLAINGTIETSKSLIKQYYPSAIGGLVSATSGCSYKYFVLDRYFVKH